MNKDKAVVQIQNSLEFDQSGIDIAQLLKKVTASKNQNPLTNDPPSRVERIERLHLEVASHFTIALGKAVEIGQLLTEQKAELKHGKWLPWIEENLPFTDQTARNYMQLWDRREDLELLNISNLKTAYEIVKNTSPIQHYTYTPEGFFDSAKYPDPFSHCDDEQKRKWLAMWMHDLLRGARDPWALMEWVTVRYTFDSYFNGKDTGWSDKKDTLKYISGPNKLLKPPSRRSSEVANKAVAAMLKQCDDNGQDILKMKFSCLNFWMANDNGNNYQAVKEE